MEILICWIGNTDLRAPNKFDTKDLGPVARALEEMSFDKVVLIDSDHYPSDTIETYIAWLHSRTRASIECFKEPLSGPTEFTEIHQAIVRVVSHVREDHPQASLSFHLSPGTPAMCSMWILLAKTRFPARLIESSWEQGARVAIVPFEISAEFIPNLLQRPDEELKRLSDESPPHDPAFEDILHRSAAMQQVLARARRVAPRSIPVLIEGESGTGKELLARALHRAGPRKKQAFVSVNCGAIPTSLIEPTLFGYDEGAFTGATADKPGLFEAADGGTLFLDEVGELSPAVQVALLRTLQEGEVLRVGSTKPRKINVRVIAATNRSLIEEVSEGRFREDLFYRLAVAILHLPPLRERAGDLSLLLDRLMERINKESQSEPGYQHKTLSIGARNVFLQHEWPGNVRELLNTLRRTAVWSSEATITEEDAVDALLQRTKRTEDAVLNRRLGEGFKLQDLLDQVTRHYLERAWAESQHTKSKSAKLLGFSNYQTLSNWMDKYNVK